MFLREFATKIFSTIYLKPLPVKYVLFASLAVEEAGPLEAGLLTAHPEHRGDPHDQHHQVLDQEQGQVRTAGLLHL